MCTSLSIPSLEHRRQKVAARGGVGRSAHLTISGTTLTPVGSFSECIHRLRQPRASGRPPHAVCRRHVVTHDVLLPCAASGQAPSAAGTPVSQTGGRRLIPSPCADQPQASRQSLCGQHPELLTRWQRAVAGLSLRVWELLPLDRVGTHAIPTVRFRHVQCLIGLTDQRT